MTEPTDDEQWAAGLRDRTLGAVPPVPVDVLGAVRTGRRRRALRTAGVRGAVLVAACGLAFAVVPAAVRGLGSSSQDSADSGAAVAGGAPAMAETGDLPAPGAGPAASDAEQVSVTKLASLVRAGTLPSGDVVVVQDGIPDLEGYLASLGTVSLDDEAVPAAPIDRSDWPRVTVDCLAGAGWQATLEGDGWQVELGGDKADAFVVDLAACVEAHPVR